MANSKEKIIEQAKALFEKKGYRNVSLREIAEAAGTTIGNLTYHFPQKEDLILSMQEGLYADYLDDYTDSADEGDGEMALRRLLQSFRQAKRNREDNAFFYRNIVELSQQSSVVAENMRDFRLKNNRFYLSSFMRMKESGIMRSDISEAQYETLAYTIASVSFLWKQDDASYYDEDMPSFELDDGLNDLIYPYLTDRGIALYDEIAQALGT